MASTEGEGSRRNSSTMGEPSRVKCSFRRRSHRQQGATVRAGKKVLREGMQDIAFELL
jgi:hypothetical protein